MTLQIKAGVTSWRSITVDNIFKVCTAMNDSGNPYGLTEASDPHMMKNSEWGAVAYLSQNATYGKGSEVEKNGNSSYLTGGGDYKTNTAQSTTNNVTGVYDMSGGANEYVAAYINNGHDNLTTYGESLINSVNAGNTKYADVYKVTSDSQSNNYNNAQPTQGQGTPTKDTGHYGDTVWETSNNYSSMNSWYGDYSRFPFTNYPFFNRGGRYDNRAASVGVFCFNYNTGDPISGHSFRVVVPVL